MNIRLANTIDNSLKVVSSIAFKKWFRDNCFLIFDFEGKIRGLSEKASKHFEMGKNIESYHEEFEQINKVKNIQFFNSKEPEHRAQRHPGSEKSK